MSTRAIIKITLTNDFHDTQITLRPRNGKLSLRQVNKSKRRLCPSRDCICGDALGTRGEQSVEIEQLYDRGVLIGAEIRKVQS
jgi:hypothetical protein